MIYIINAIIHTVIGFSLGVWYCRKKLEKALREGTDDERTEAD